MIDIIMSSSMIILVIVIIRRLCLGRISRRIQYGLWLAVVLRLLIPVPLFQYSFHTASGMENVAASVRNWESKVVFENRRTGGGENNGQIMDNSKQTENIGAQDLEYADGQGGMPHEKNGIEGRAVTVKVLLQMVRWLGVVLCGGVIVVNNLIFLCRLKKTRRRVGKFDRLTVYETDMFSTPCLYGFFMPAIYMTEKSWNMDTDRELILLHEGTHYRHMDHIWAMVRCLCVVLYWFHPLVWLAAALSARDSELACDESVLLQVGETRRREYGELILALADKGKSAGFVYCSTGMSGSGREVKERIQMILQRRKVLIWLCVAAVFVVTVTAVGSFGKTTAGEENIQETVQDDKVYMNVQDKQEDEAARTSVWFLEEYDESDYYDIELTPEENEKRMPGIGADAVYRVKNRKCFLYKTIIDGVTCLGGVKPCFYKTAYLDMDTGKMIQSELLEGYVETVYNTQDKSCIDTFYAGAWQVEDYEAVAEDNIVKRYRSYSLTEEKSGEKKTFFTVLLEGSE